MTKSGGERSAARSADFREFDPDAQAEGGGIYGLPHSPDEAAVIVIPVPWEPTTSGRGGASDGPAAILQASRQVDLFDRETGHPYAGGIAMLPVSQEVRTWSDRAKELARAPAPERERGIPEVDRLGAQLNEWVRRSAEEWLERGRLVGIAGGDHASPYGLIQAVAERRPGLGILQLDAHADLRQAYEGFRWSHASVFWNVTREIPGVSRLVQVGVRDYASREDELIRASAGRIVTFFDPELRRRLQDGKPWSELAREIVDALPRDVYLSVDIDGLDPALCPHTGTPVPGGLSFAEATSILRLIAESGRRIVGFDLCEVAPGPPVEPDWDGNVGARLLYKMIGFSLLSGR